MFDFLFKGGNKTSPPEIKEPLVTKATKANKVFTENVNAPSSGDYITSYTQADTIYSCVSYATDIVSQINFKLYKKTGKKLTEFKDKKILKWFNQPNPYQSMADILSLYVQSYLLTGNAYLTFEKVGINFEGWVLDPTQMKVVPDDKKFLNGYIYAEKYTYKTNEILHFKNSVVNNPYYGVSYLSSLVDPLLLDSYATGELVDFYKNSLIAQGILSSEYPLTQKQIDNLKEQFKSLYGKGGSDRYGFMLVPNNIKYQSFKASMKDSMILDTLGVSSDKIYQVFRLSPKLLGKDNSGSTNGTELKSLKALYINNFIRPQINKLVKSWENHFRRILKNDNFYIEADYTQIPEVNTALTEKIDAVKEALANGIITRNEARSELGFDVIEETDSMLDSIISPAFLLGTNPIDLRTGKPLLDTNSTNQGGSNE